MDVLREVVLAFVQIIVHSLVILTVLQAVGLRVKVIAELIVQEHVHRAVQVVVLAVVLAVVQGDVAHLVIQVVELLVGEGVA